MRKVKEDSIFKYREGITVLYTNRDRIDMTLQTLKTYKINAVRSGKCSCGGAVLDLVNEVGGITGVCTKSAIPVAEVINAVRDVKLGEIDFE